MFNEWIVLYDDLFETPEEIEDKLNFSKKILEEKSKKVEPFKKYYESKVIRGIVLELYTLNDEYFK